ncbi:MAG: restriction endonuclease [Pseudomonadota bacterium]
MPLLSTFHGRGGGGGVACNNAMLDVQASRLKTAAPFFITVINSPATREIWWFSFFFEESEMAGFFVCLIIALVIFAGMGMSKKQDKIVKDAFNENKFTLLTKYKQMKYTDDYGNIVTDDFINELDYFAETTIAPRIRREVGGGYGAIDAMAVRSQLIRLFNKLLDSNSPQLSSLENVETGEDYEKFVGDLIEPSGWSVVYTPKTGDQGVDIIAQKNGIKVAVQCKFYQGSVPNSAIQEIYSGAQFYEAAWGVLVTSGIPTKSARQLAESLGVIYCHHDQVVKELNRIVPEEMWAA